MTEFRENPLPGLADQWQATAPVLRGILLMCVASVFFSVMHVLVRYVARDVPPLQTAFLRNIFGVIVFAPLLMSNGLAFLRTERIGLHAVRGVLNAVAMLMFFTALTLTPVARVTALSFSAPLFMALLSVMFLGERFRIRRWVAIGIGFAGTLIILRPGIGVIGTIAQLALTQALKETEPTAVLPFDFLKLVWATLLGMWVFGELPDVITWIGAMVVFASGFFLAWREHQERRKAGNRGAG